MIRGVPRNMKCLAMNVAQCERFARGEEMIERASLQIRRLEREQLGERVLHLRDSLSNSHRRLCTIVRMNISSPHSFARTAPPNFFFKYCDDDR